MNNCLKVLISEEHGLTAAACATDRLMASLPVSTFGFRYGDDRD